jgi:hypothetical protein
MNANVQHVLRLLALTLMLVAIIGSMAAHTLEQKVFLSLVGSALTGAFVVCRVRYAGTNETGKLSKLQANIEEAQRLIQNSDYSLYRKAVLGITPSGTSSFPKTDIESTLKHPIFILAGFSVGTAFLFTPAFLEFNFQHEVPPIEIAKIFVLQLTMLLLIGSGFAGIFINLLGWFKPQKPEQP